MRTNGNAVRAEALRKEQQAAEGGDAARRKNEADKVVRKQREAAFLQAAERQRLALLAEQQRLLAELAEQQRLLEEARRNAVERQRLALLAEQQRLAELAKQQRLLEEARRRKEAEEIARKQRELEEALTVELCVRYTSLVHHCPLVIRYEELSERARIALEDNNMYDANLANARRSALNYILEEGRSV